MSHETSRRDLLKGTLIALGAALLIQPIGGVMGFQSSPPKNDGNTAATPGSGSAANTGKGKKGKSKGKRKKGTSKKGKKGSGKSGTTTPTPTAPK